MTSDAAVQAARLRLAGVALDVIASRLGLQDANAARSAVREGLHASGGFDADLEAQLDLARLDRMLVGVWRDAAAGDEAAVRVAIKIIDRRAAVLAAASGSGFVSDRPLTPLDELSQRRGGRAARARVAE